MGNPEWYSAKTIYRHNRVERGTLKTVFEERVVLFLAKDFDDALSKADAEASEDCCNSDETTYLGFADVYHLFDEEVGNRTEVYSLMRESNLRDNDYLDHFCDDGKELRRRD